MDSMSNKSTSVIVGSWILVLGWMSVIFALSSISVIPGPRVFFWDFILKKTAHMFEYAILFILVTNALKQWFPNNLNLYLVTFVICISYAISDEYHQSFTPGRSPQPLDVYYDFLGMITVYGRSRKLL
jgi:VanZ family protein